MMIIIIVIISITIIMFYNTNNSNKHNHHHNTRVFPRARLAHATRAAYSPPARVNLGVELRLTERVAAHVGLDCNCIHVET